MTMTSASRSRSLLVAAAAMTAWTQGCMTYQSPRHASLAPDTEVRVRASVPFHVLPVSPTDGSLGVACRTTLVEGRVSQTRADTAYLVQITRVVPASEGDRACAFLRGATLALPGAQLPTSAVSVLRFSGSRMASVAGALLVFGALLRLASPTS
jgi:hypothetical protein